MGNYQERAYCILEPDSKRMHNHYSFEDLPFPPPAKQSPETSEAPVICRPDATSVWTLLEGKVFPLWAGRSWVDFSVYLIGAAIKPVAEHIVDLFVTSAPKLSAISPSNPIRSSVRRSSNRW